MLLRLLKSLRTFVYSTCMHVHMHMQRGHACFIALGLLICFTITGNTELPRLAEAKATRSSLSSKIISPRRNTMCCMTQDPWWKLE